MNSQEFRGRRPICVMIACAVVLIVLSGCAPIPEVIDPPLVQDGMAELELHASPADIALTRLDLPAGFQLAAEKSSGPEYLALYLRPSSLDPEASGGNSLLSVLVSVGVYTTTVDAKTVYLRASADPSGKAVEDIALVSGSATDIVTQSFDGAAQGANASEAFRVTYSLMDQPVFEYGHRFRLGNVLAHIVVAAVGDQDEPQHLLKDTRDLVQRQIDHIAEAAAQTATE
jgi:hypothetical protein